MSVPNSIKFPLEYFAFQDNTFGKFILQEHKPHKPGFLSLKYITDRAHESTTPSQDVPVQHIFPSLPEDLKIRAPKEEEERDTDSSMIPRNHENVVISRMHGTPLTEQAPLLYTYIHEARVIHEIEKVVGKQPGLMQFKGFVTVKFDEIPPTVAGGQERVVGYATSPESVSSIWELAMKWSQGDANAGLSASERSRIKSGARALLQKVHEAGYAHNDICPDHIGLDHNKNATLINFHASAKMGERLNPAFQYPWGIHKWCEKYDQYTQESSKEADEYFMSMFCKWLDEAFSKGPLAVAA